MNDVARNEERFVRQAMLAEVGARGQKAIASSPARVGGDSLAHRVATRYVTLAGFREVVPGAIDRREDATHGSMAFDDAGRGLASEVAGEVLTGARAALREIRRALASVEDTSESKQR